MTSRVARTVLRDVAETELGITYAHEHLVLDSPLIAAAFPHILLDDSTIAIQEVEACSSAGVQSMVDAMPCSAGRDASRLAGISRATGVNIIAATGLHHERYYGSRHWTALISIDALAQLFIDDITIGIDSYDYTGPIVQRTEHRAGVIKVASGGGDLSSRDRRLFEAAAIAHIVTGAPVITHCEHGHGALEQVTALTDLGVKPESILLSHIDKITDLAYHLDIADSGAWSVFDQSVRQAGEEVPSTANLVGELSRRSKSGHILLGTDGARRDLWAAYGGSPGLRWLASEFPARLKLAGIESDEIHALYVSNPAQALTFIPR